MVPKSTTREQLSRIARAVSPFRLSDTIRSKQVFLALNKSRHLFPLRLFVTASTSSRRTRSFSISDTHASRRSELPNLLHQEGFNGHLPDLVSVDSMEIRIGAGRDMAFSPGLRLAVSRGRFVLKSMKVSVCRFNGPTLSHTSRSSIPWRRYHIYSLFFVNFRAPSSFLFLFSRPPFSSLGHHPIVVLDRIFYGFCLPVLPRRTNQTHRLMPKCCT